MFQHPVVIVKTPPAIQAGLQMTVRNIRVPQFNHHAPNRCPSHSLSCCIFNLQIIPESDCCPTYFYFIRSTFHLPPLFPALPLRLGNGGAGFALPSVKIFTSVAPPCRSSHLGYPYHIGLQPCNNETGFGFFRSDPPRIIVFSVLVVSPCAYFCAWFVYSLKGMAVSVVG